MRFYVLTSRNLMLLKRHFVTLPVKESVVVINTVDENYLKQSVEYCKKIHIEYHVTESNGNPGKGKNAVQDVFLASGDEYCVQIDGDDMVTPFGVDFYKDLAKQKRNDGLMLLSTTAVARQFEQNTYSQWPDAPRYEMNLNEAHKRYPMKRKEIERALENKEIWYNAVMRIKKHQLQWNYPPDIKKISQCPRFLFWSRKLCDHFRFDEDLLVGEDTIACWHLRDVASRGLIRLDRANDIPYNTYIYDHRRSGIMRPLSVALDFSWAVPLADKMDSLAKNWTVSKDFSLPEYFTKISRTKQRLLPPIIREYFL